MVFFCELLQKGHTNLAAIVEGLAHSFTASTAFQPNPDH